MCVCVNEDAFHASRCYSVIECRSFAFMSCFLAQKNVTEPSLCCVYSCLALPSHISLLSINLTCSSDSIISRNSSKMLSSSTSSESHWRGLFESREHRNVMYLMEIYPKILNIFLICLMVMFFSLFFFSCWLFCQSVTRHMLPAQRQISSLVGTHWDCYQQQSAGFGITVGSP